MSRRNLEVVERWLEAYNARHADGMIECSAPDIEFRSIFAAIESGGVFRGYPGIAAYFKALDDAYEHFRVVFDDLLDAGAAVVLMGHAEWRGKESGIGGKTAIFPTFWIRSGKVFRAETFASREDALEAVGWPE